MSSNLVKFNALSIIYGIHLLFIFCPTTLKSQDFDQFRIHNYPPSTFQGHPRILSVELNSDGILFAGSASNELYWYIGGEWKKKILPARKIQSLSPQEEGSLWIEMEGEFGLLKKDMGELRYTSMHPNAQKSFPKNIGQISHTHISANHKYFFSQEFLVIQDLLALKSISLKNKYDRSFFVHGMVLLSHYNGKGIDQLSEDFSYLKPFVESDFTSQIVDVLPGEKENCWIITERNGIFLYQIGAEIQHFIKPEAISLFGESPIHCAHIMPEGNLVIGSAGNGIFIFDQKGNVIEHINHSSGLLDDFIQDITNDQLQNIWIANNNGMAMIEGIPLALENDGIYNLPGSILHAAQSLDDMIISTSKGIFQLSKDTEAKLQSLGISYFTLELNSKSDIKEWISSTENGVFLNTQKGAKKFAEAINPVIHQLQSHPDYIAIISVAGDYKLYQNTKAEMKLVFELQNLLPNQQQITNIIETSQGDIFLGTSHAKAFHIQHPMHLNRIKLKTINEFPDLDLTDKVFPCLINNEVKYFTGYGIYKTDAIGGKVTLDSIYKTFGFESKQVQIDMFRAFKNNTFAMHYLDGNSQGIRVLYLDRSNQVSWEDIPLTSEGFGPVSNIFLDASNIWISSFEKIFRYPLKTNLQQPFDFHATIHKVSNSIDSVLFSGIIMDKSENNLTSSYHANGLKFHYGSNHYGSKNKILYSHKLVGHHNNWSDWMSQRNIAYPNLDPGIYTFSVRSKNQFGRVSEYASIGTRINAPWYFKPWAIGLYILSGIAIIYLAFQMYHRRLLKEKRRLEQIVSERTIELKEKNISLQESFRVLEQTQQQLIQSEKLASLGQLTAGVAHEINNPINFITSSVQALKMDIGELHSKSNLQSNNEIFEEMNLMISSIEEGALRTTNIVQSLLSFASQSEENFTSADINQGLDTTLTLLKFKIPSGITVVKNYKALPKFNCQISRLNQVFMNVLDNAIQAIGEHGKIDISTKKEGEQVFISIKDDGPGMSEETLAKIFDPFFTTKEIGQGTGLGMSISYGIVKDHGGEIEVISELGKGTEVTIFLPVDGSSRI